MIAEITKFQNCQVVINTYSDEELIQRDGFWFEHIVEDHGFLHFIKAGTIVSRIEVDGRKLTKEPIFKNFYTIRENKQRTEIYFP
ncbi:hypothetical protein [Neobacillus sp. PS3-40]|uniref:hypothetical protein n=1 Tax=Neobacillus sp. PS3-40 TaxID=3070679 RepID=UPI0027E140E5|nr:hypothetical protein [Neobacillus sp. PS3-40]WML44917.1 hypothetical protein RCG20_03140 [Neobacillus sp. PS3-40]